MNDGLVLLAGWAQWLALVLVLVVSVARGVAATHEQTGTRYRRASAPDDGAGLPPADGGYREG